ncbi:MAG: hypothetical protein K6D37_06395 [Prevotella sp.]|nr:hypothetical protein [Prevotella sp.]
MQKIIDHEKQPKRHHPEFEGKIDKNDGRRQQADGGKGAESCGVELVERK